MSVETKRAAVRELERLKNEKRRRNEESYLERYIPHEKQKEFHACLSPVRLFIGSNQSGKSRGGCSEDVAVALGYRPWNGTETRTPPSKVLIVGPDFKNHHSEITVPYLRKMIPPSELAGVERDSQGTTSKFIFKNGSIIKLMSYEQHLKKAAGSVSPFEGHMWDHVHFDEPPPYGVYTATQRGVIARAGTIIMTLTPLRCAWIYDKLYMKADNLNPGQEIGGIHVTQVAIYDNPHLNDEWRDRFLDSLDPDEREAREYGRFMHLIGLVYKMWHPEVHIVDMPYEKIEPSWPKGLVVDPHDRKPFAMAWFAVTPTNDIIFYNEWPKRPFHDLRGSNKTVKDYAEIIREEEKGQPGGIDSVLWRIMDPNFGNSPKLGLVTSSVVDEFARERIFFTTDIKDSLAEGHLAVNKLIRYDRDNPISATNKPKLFVHKDCFNLKFGMSHYLWDEWRAEGKGLKEKPQDEFKDFPDLVRYVAIYEPRYVDTSDDGRVRIDMDKFAHSGLG